jgi:hypothetical protein
MYIGCGYKGNFALVARYEDDIDITFYGRDEDDCIWQMAQQRDKYGEVTWYSGVNDDDYVDGEYCPMEIRYSLWREEN